MTRDNMDMTREDMYSLVSSTMDQTQRDINDLENSISGWSAEEQAMSNDHYDGSKLGPDTLKRVDEYLEGFFANKRRSAERRVQEDEDAKQQIQSASVQTLDLSSSALAPLIRKFFNNLTVEQWRELSEGEYNVAVKELLIFMGVDMMSVISESVIRTNLQSMNQFNTYENKEKESKLWRTSDGDAPGMEDISICPMMTGSSTDFRGREEAEMQELGGVDRNEKERLIVGVVDILMEKYALKIYLESFTKLPNTSSTFTSDIKKDVEICLIQAFSDVIGEDIAGMILSDFTEAIVTEVMDVVNSVTSMAKQQSLDTGSVSAFAPPSIQLSRVSEARTLAGAILTMQSFLTGRTNEVMSKFMTQEIEDTVIETVAYCGLSSGSEEEAVSSEADIIVSASDLLEPMKVDEAQEEKRDDSGREIITIPETEASRASEEVFEVAEKFGTGDTEEEEEEEEKEEGEEAAMPMTSTPISMEEEEEEDMEIISIPDTKAYCSACRASEEIKDAVSFAASFAISKMLEADNSDEAEKNDSKLRSISPLISEEERENISIRETEVAERFEADKRETASDLLEQMKLDEAQQEEEEAKLGTTSPLIFKEEGDDSGRKSITILETEPYSSPSRASEEVFEVTEKLEADITETSSDVNEQIRLDEAQEEEEEAKLGTPSTPISKEEGDDSERETISILETEPYSSPSRASEEVFEVTEKFEADITETASDLLEQMNVDEAQEKEEEAQLGTTSPLISKEDGGDSGRETMCFPETEPSSSPSRASEEVFEVAKKFEADKTETASDVNEQMILDEAQEEATMGTPSTPISKGEDDSGRESISFLETEPYSSPSRASEEVFEVAEKVEADITEEEEEATMGTTSTPISKEEGDDSERKSITILETEPYSSPSRASEEVFEVAEKFEADITETASDLLEQMKVDEAQEKEEEAQLGTTSPLISKEDGDDSGRETMSFPETEPSSSPSRASEEVFEVAKKFEADKTETASDVNEQMILDEAQEEATMGTPSTPISKGEDDSGRESISFLETEPYSSPSRASEEVFEVAEKVEADITEEEEEATMGTTSTPISKEEGDDSERKSITILETEPYSSPSRASEEVFEVAEKFEADITETASDVNEQMRLDEAQEEEEEAQLGTPSTPISKEEGDDSERETITILETEPYSGRSRASEEVFEVAEKLEADITETASDLLEQMKVDEAQEKEEEAQLESTSPPALSSASEETPTLTSRDSSTSQPVEKEDIRELSERDADQDLRERMINMSVGVMNAIVNEFPYSSSLQAIATLDNAFRSSKKEKRSKPVYCPSPDDSDSPK